MVSPFGVVELDRDFALRSLAVFVWRVKFYEAVRIATSLNPGESTGDGHTDGRRAA
jgi:hypothetical protein